MRLPKHWTPLFSEFFSFVKNPFQWLAALASTKRELFCQIDVDFNVDIDVDVWEFHIFNKTIQWHPRHRQAGHCGLDWPNISPILANTTWRLFFRNFLRTFFWGKFALDRNISPILANMNASWRFFFRHLNTFFCGNFSLARNICTISANTNAFWRHFFFQFFTG